VFRHTHKFFLVVVMCLLTSMLPALASGMGDPLRPPGYATSYGNNGGSALSKPTWWVSEILFSGGRRIAIVNNVAVAIGDHVNGAKVVDIKPEHVVLKYKNGLINARLHTLLVKEQNLKKQID
jgi:MSHA biogenesis protein MshK